MTTPEAFTTAHHDALRAWARGLYPLEAASELLIRGCGGRFAETGQPWVHVEDCGRPWTDFGELTEQLAGGPWSGGERRLLTVAASLGADGGLLNDNVAGLDRDNHAPGAGRGRSRRRQPRNTDPSPSCSTTPASPTETPTGSVPDRCTRGPRGGPVQG